MAILAPETRSTNDFFIPSSNRVSSAALFADSASTPDAVPLIDTIRVRGEVRGHRIPHQTIRRHEHVNGDATEWLISAIVPLPQAILRVERHRTGGGMVAVIERSMPTLREGHNVTPTSVSAAHLHIANLHLQAAEWVDWLVPSSDLSITRLDLVLDFTGVTDLNHLLSGLAALRVSRVKYSAVYRDGERGGAQTLARGPISGGWRCSLYDKHAQMMHLAKTESDPRRGDWLRDKAERCRGQVRFEVQLRSKLLRRKGMATMRDLDAEHLLRLREEYFHRVRFETPIAGASKVREVMVRLAEQGDPGYPFFGPVVGMLMAEALDLPQPRGGRTKTLTKYRKLAAHWGLTAADVLGAVGPAVGLDYATATLKVKR